MLNMNSPTVQAMLNNTPQGFGNMPVYYGASPAVSQQQVSQPTGMPYPSPKEMLSQGGEQMIYSPTSFAPQNIVGGYNPGFQAAFAGYSNPYLDYQQGLYGGYPSFGGYGGMYPYMQPMDDDARERLAMAIFNGLTYDEQLEFESDLYKTISKIVSRNLGRDEKEARECEKAFDIINKYPVIEEDFSQQKTFKPLHVQVMIGDEVVADMKPENVQLRHQDYQRNAMYVEQMKYRHTFNETNMAIYRNTLFDQAPERMFDKTDMMNLFNDGIGAILAQDKVQEMYIQSAQRAAQVYNRDSFRERLFKNNGVRTRSKMKALERYAGRYGIMPDGRPVSPGHDPAVADSFSYNPQTGQYTVTAPNFMRDRLERARESFIRSIDSST